MAIQMAPRATRADVLACLGKTRWTSEETARWALTSLRKNNAGVFDSTVRPYRCRSCRRWHIGHGR